MKKKVERQNEWQYKNMKQLAYRFNENFINEFKNACNILNVSQRSIIEQAMRETIRKANKKAD